MSSFSKILVNAALALAGVVASSTAMAQSTLVVYCSLHADWCEAGVKAFTRATGIKVSISRKGTGEALALIRAERTNPRGDVWWGGTGDPYVQAAEEGLLQAYASPRHTELHPWATRQLEITKGQSVGIYSGAITFGYNTELIKRKKLPPPTCWSDLVKPAYRGEIESSHPASSGTAYTIIATLVQIMGEDKAFGYMRELHRNVTQYTKSGNAQAQSVGRGEATIGVSWEFGFVAEASRGFPIEIKHPCEGTGYEIGAMSIIKGARNLEHAQRWYDWALSPEAQAIAAPTGSLQIPSNRKTPLDPRIPKMDGVKLIDYDFKKFGAPAERKRLIDRWEKEVNSASR
jgi:iron(III) transport system substrate-binding protein